MKGLARTEKSPGNRLVTLLKRAAKFKGITLYKLAQEAGIKRSSVYYYAKHPDRIPLGKSEVIRDLLGLSDDDWNQWVREALGPKKRKKKE